MPLPINAYKNSKIALLNNFSQKLMKAFQKLYVTESFFVGLTNSNYFYAENVLFSRIMGKTHRTLCTPFHQNPHSLISKVLPLLDVYRRAAWKQQVRMLVKGSSMLTCIPNPASGLMLGRESRSVDRTKKLPWKLVIARPRVALYGIQDDIEQIHNIYARKKFSQIIFPNNPNSYHSIKSLNPKEKSGSLPLP